MLLAEGMDLAKIKEYQQTRDQMFWAEAMPFLERLGLTRPEAISAVTAEALDLVGGVQTQDDRERGAGPIVCPSGEP
jgi:hypothetical protein